MKLVSVIIPCYNCELYVEEAVRSIINQTYQNLEILVINDGSSDKTESILLKLSEEDSRVKYIKNKENIRLIATLNKGLSLANGEYIARMDADDISLPSRIEKQVAFLEENSDVAICGTNSLHIDENNMIIGHSLMPQDDKAVKIFAKYASPFIHPSVMLRAEQIKGFSYDANYIHAEDFKLWLDILAEYKGYNLKERLIAYRYISTSISHTFSDIQQQKAKELTKPDSEFLSFITQLEDYKVCVPLYAKIIKRNKFNFNNYLSLKTLHRFMPVVVYYAFYKLKYKFLKKKLRVGNGN
ncbi:glycosyltransferase family 2 protein [Pasteurella atlantica]|uniref:glycosyltransferase family 2 protein n=1 Tax=Pasteurellaceae TaxID=712 RepID=UPI0027486EF8|nr:glycosyltransferase family 2 protein [Pasteurella atlantica]MDP8098748.1 glycosyltransferase family 2 protein [Pasteurella atlantica]MDP8106860.1 glycosyltransferase family 2 protein [Pasteurella atlantica]MDP8116550.1 glycosyltransferase family 2 protein [Pasteurella atlantica]